MVLQQKGGIYLEVENYQQFIRQLNTASGTVKGFGQSVQQASSRVNASANAWLGVGANAQLLAEQLSDSGEAAQVTASQYSLLGIAMSALGAVATKAAVGVGLQASRIEELETLLEVSRQNAIFLANANRDMAKAASLSSEAVQEQVQGIRELHLSGLVANEVVANLIRYNLDWTKATELARLAQDAATFAMQDSSQAVQGLIHGITTLQPRVLRTYGLMINLNEAYRKYAEANNLVAKDLTTAQRQQAAFQEVLALAPSIAGAYEASMQTASKQVRSLQTDLIDLSEAFGEEYTPAITAAVGTGRDLLHALTELDDEWQAAIVGATGTGTALLTITGASLTLASRLPYLTEAFRNLSGAIGLSSGAMATFMAGIPLLVGAITYIIAKEKAHQEEAAAVLESKNTYQDYLAYLEIAGVESKALSEELFNMAKAAQEVGEAFDALAFQEAAEDIDAEIDTLIDYIDALEEVTFDTMDVNVATERMKEQVDKLLPSLSDLQVQMLKNRDILVEMLIAHGLEGDALVAYTRHILEAAAAEEYWRLARAPIGDHEERMLKVKYAAEEVADATILAAESTDLYVQHADDLGEIAELWADLSEAVIDAVEKADKKIEDARTKRNRALEDLDRKYFLKTQDAWAEYRDALTENEKDLADFHAGTLQELLDLDYDYLKDRNDAWTKYQQELADLERDLQRDIEDATRQRAENLADLDREYARDLEDARRELLQDMEDLQADHTERMAEIERRRQTDSLELEQEYQRRLYEIQNLWKQKQLDLDRKYEESASDIRLKYARIAVEQMQARGLTLTDEIRQQLVEYFQQDILPANLYSNPELIALYEKMLAELADLHDDRFFEEQDLSDDIKREQEDRLAELESWLKEEQAAIEAAYQERLAEEQERIEREREEREREYAQELEDLKRALEREREEIARDYQRKLDDIRLQGERERAAAAENYERRLEDLDIQYEREKDLIRRKLEEQNQIARDKYLEAVKDIRQAKGRERDEINQQFERTKTDVADDLDDMVREAADKYGLLPSALKPTHDQLKSDLSKMLFSDPDSLTNQWLSFIDNLRNNILQAHSPSRVFVDMGESILAGLQKGMGGATVGDMLTGSLDASALQANIQAALPAQQAFVPGGMGVGSTTYGPTTHLNVTAHYARQQSESTIRQDLMMWQMMMR